MLDEEQRRTVLEMFSKGKSISEISRQVGISIPSVCRVIAGDVEKDAEILRLEKELRKTELRRKIEELREPITIRSKLDMLGKAMNYLMMYVLRLWELKPKLRQPTCFYCGGLLGYCEIKNPKGEIVGDAYKCTKCRRTFPLA